MREIIRNKKQKTKTHSARLLLVDNKLVVCTYFVCILLHVFFKNEIDYQVDYSRVLA